VPGINPKTTPVEEMLATEVPLELHVPLPVASLIVVVLPEHTLVVPVMADGVVFTVTVVDVLQPVERV
jgi:hypothetical protein